jgi:ribonuclease HI
MPWMRHRLRDAEVWARVGADGALVADKAGRVDVVYRDGPGAKLYRAAARNLEPLGGEMKEIEISAPAPAEPAAPAEAPADAIHVWTDGACSGNPGPAGIGIVIIDGDRRREIGEFLGDGTNQIAELTAIERGLEEITDKARPVLVYSDSAYAIGMVTKPWKAKANVALVERLRAKAKEFSDLRFVKVLGHSGIAENEKTDQLATAAVRARSSNVGTGEKLTATTLTRNTAPRRGTQQIPSAPIGSPDAPKRK